MKCDEIAERLSAYADGELIRGDKADVEDHLRGCDACARHLASLRALQTSVRDVLHEPVESVDMTESVMMLLPAGRMSRGARASWVWATGAAVLVLLVLGICLRPSVRDHAERRIAVRPHQVRIISPTVRIVSKQRAPAHGTHRVAHRLRTRVVRPHPAPRVETTPIEAADLVASSHSTAGGPDLSGTPVVERTTEGAFLSTTVRSASMGGEPCRIRLTRLPYDTQRDRGLLARAPADGPHFDIEEAQQ
jgi:anti-sigma factor RsiW